MFNLKNFDKWDTFTWDQMLRSNARWARLSIADRRSLITQLKILRRYGDYDTFKDRNVTGAISEGWSDLSDIGCGVVKTKPTPMFQAVQSRIVKKIGFDPVDIMLEYNEVCSLRKIPWIERDLGRCLRNLMPLLREDLIFDNLKNRNLDVVAPSAAMNASKHADIIYNYKSKSGKQLKITIWCYQASPKGIHKVQDKITGIRAGVNGCNISTGVNLLAPFNTAFDKIPYLDWYIPSNAYINKLLRSIFDSKTLKLSYGDPMLTNSSIYSNFVIFNKK